MDIKAYEALIDNIFQAVITQYGFKKIQVDAQRFEYWVVYRNSTTEISVSYEMGSLPWVRIADVRNLQNASSLNG
jgi:hypothetical protein